jgi:hypothetical protein
VELALGPPAGDLPGVPGDRAVRDHPGHHGRRPAGDQRVLGAAAAGLLGRGQGQCRAHGRGRRLGERAVRAVPVRGAGRRRGPAGRAGFRPGDADPLGLLLRFLPQRRQPVGGRARERPPVVRRLRVGRAVEGDLAQRGLRHLRRVAVVRGAGRGHGPGALRLPVRDPARRVLDGGTGRPGCRGDLRWRRLRPGRDDAAPAAPGHR